MNLGGDEPSAIKSVGNGECNLGNNSITLSKKDDDFGKSSSVENTRAQGFVIVKTLFKSKDADTTAPGHGGHGNEFGEEKKPRDIVDDVKGNFSHEKPELDDYLQATAPNDRNVDSKEIAKEDVLNLWSSSKRSERTCNSVSEMPSNVRLGRRRSTRLRRFSNSSRSTKEEEKEACEVRV